MKYELNPDPVTEEYLAHYRATAEAGANMPGEWKGSVWFRRASILGLVTEIERLRSENARLEALNESLLLQITDEEIEGDRLQAERDRLAELVEMAIVFQVAPTVAILRYDSDDPWIVERTDTRPMFLSNEGDWRETADYPGPCQFPTREAAFTAWERSKETAL